MGLKMKYDEYNKIYYKKYKLISLTLDFNFSKAGRNTSDYSFLTIGKDEDFLHVLPIFYDSDLGNYKASFACLIPTKSIISVEMVPSHNLLFYCGIKNNFINEALKLSMET